MRDQKVLLHQVGNCIADGNPAYIVQFAEPGLAGQGLSRTVLPAGNPVPDIFRHLLVQGHCTVCIQHIPPLSKTYGHPLWISSLNTGLDTKVP